MPKTNETIEAMVRDFTQVQPRSKSEVRERIHNLLATKDAACEERVREAKLAVVEEAEELAWDYIVTATREESWSRADLQLWLATLRKQLTDKE